MTMMMLLSLLPPTTTPYRVIGNSTTVSCAKNESPTILRGLEKGTFLINEPRYEAATEANAKPKPGN